MRACAKYDFEKNFKHCGSALTADGSEDHEIKLQGISDFSFSMDDTKRDAITGEMPTGQLEAAEGLAEASDDELEDLSENSDGEEDGEEDCDCQSLAEGDCTEEYVPEPGWKIVPKYSFKSQKELVNTFFAYKFTTGWERGRVTGIEKNSNSPDCGMFIVKFTTEDELRCLGLDEEDYDVDYIWVQIKRA